MIEETISEKDLAFLKELEKYENKWVAIHRSGDDEEIIVGSGNDANEAMHEAEEKGFSDAALLKLHRFDRCYVPTVLS
jgi:hypothetical protein